MNKNIGLGILLGLGMVALPVEAQNVYELTAPKVEKIIYTKHLKLGGTAPDGGSIEVNSFYMLRNGKPLSCRTVGTGYLEDEGWWTDHHSYLCVLEYPRGKGGRVRLER